jgi:hypothetical protein
MFPFDLSATNILLLTAAVALLILFITVLMKLNPSTQKKETYERDITLERQKPFQIEQSLPPKPLSVAKENVQATAEKPLMPVNTTVGELSLQKNQEDKTPIVSQSKEVISKPQKTVASRVATSSSRGDCLHQFGYLRTLPKNTPIPDECLGCQRVVECLVEAKKR